MKIAGQRVEAFLSSPDPKIRVILVYGPDAGLVQERLKTLGKTVVADLSDPFRVVELTLAHLKEDPARLGDEAAAIAMTGGRRLIILRDGADGWTRAIEAFLADPKGDALVVVEGGELAPRSSLRKLCEGAANAGAIACYADDGTGLAGLIRQSLDGYGLAADRDALAYLAAHLGGDRRLTRSELEKLALYMGGPGRVGLGDAAAVIGDGSLLSMDDLILAAADGEHDKAQRMLGRLLGEGIGVIAVIRALLRHFQRLHLVQAALQQGATLDQAMAALRPPPHFRAAPKIRAQSGRWTAPRLAQALQILMMAEIDCKKTGAPDQAICGRLIFSLAQMAGRR